MKYLLGATVILLVIVSGCIVEDECSAGYCCPEVYIEECIGSPVQIKGTYPLTAEIAYLTMDHLIVKNNVGNNINSVKLIVDDLNLLSKVRVNDKILVTGTVEEYLENNEKRTAIRVSDILLDE